MRHQMNYCHAVCDVTMWLPSELTIDTFYADILFCFVMSSADIMIHCTVLCALLSLLAHFFAYDNHTTFM